MTNKHIIYAKAPTAYQRSSIACFGMEVTRHGNGSITAKVVYNSYSKAKLRLMELVPYLADSFPQEQEMFAEIEQHGQLTYDGCTAKIYTEEEFNWI